MKKYIAYLLIPLLLLLLNLGCDDECVNCVQYSPNCIFLENVSNSECLAEDLTRTCETYSCSSSTYRFSLRDSSCEILDCTTVTCDVFSGTPIIEQTGIITIEGLEQSNLPFGIVEVDDLQNGSVQEEYDCLILTP